MIYIFCLHNFSLKWIIKNFYLSHYGPFKHCLAAHPMRAKEIPPLKRHADTCHTISTYIAHPLVVPTQEAHWYLPWDCYISHAHSRSHSRGILILALEYRDPTQEAYWYLPWDCYLYCTPTHCAHSRGILILAMGLLPITCPLIVPTQEAFWCFPWDCYLSHAYSLHPLKRLTDTCRGTATGPFSRPTLCPT